VEDFSVPLVDETKHVLGVRDIAGMASGYHADDRLSKSVLQEADARRKYFRAEGCPPLAFSRAIGNVWVIGKPDGLTTENCPIEEKGRSNCRLSFASTDERSALVREEARLQGNLYAFLMEAPRYEMRLHWRDRSEVVLKDVDVDLALAAILLAAEAHSVHGDHDALLVMEDR
jgi:hypothetical protein